MKTIKLTEKEKTIVLKANEVTLVDSLSVVQNRGSSIIYTSTEPFSDTNEGRTLCPSDIRLFPKQKIYYLAKSECKIHVKKERF